MADTDTDDAGFDDGFVAEALSAPTETPGQGAEQQTEQEPRDDVQEPPEYAQLTKAELAELKDRAAAVEAIRAAQDKSFGTAFGKIGGIERQLRELQTGTQIEISEDEIRTLREDGWDVLANALDKVRNLRGLPGGAGLDESRVNEVVQQRMAELPVVVEQTVEKRLLAREFPDWEQYTATPEFLGWAAKQPAEYQQKLANTWDSQFIGEAIKKAKEASRPTQRQGAQDQPQRRSRFEAAVTPRGNGAPPSASTVDDFDAGFNE